MIVVLMGVAGSGKSTIGHLLASETGWPFAEGDDYHSAANKAKMHSGIPLTDEDRAPWLKSLHQVLLEWSQKGESGILACSALKESYRKTLKEGVSDLHFVLLEASPEVIEQRLRARANHFMNPDLIASQFATLEIPSDALRVSILDSPQKTVDFIRQRLKA